MYTAHDMINCKLHPETYIDISSSRRYILNKILNKNETYRININYIDNYNFLTTNDKNIIEKACNKWKNIIILQTKPGYNTDMKINVYVEKNDPNVLGSATCTSTFKGIPDAGNIWINSSNWETQKSFKKDDGNSQAYYTILHELGHIFGIGTKWHHLIKNNMYQGTNALREYRKILNNTSLTGIPLEDDGGGGTSGSHIEEGDEWILSKNNRYHDGHFHSGLDRELMTGWAENDTGLEPLSKVSVGFLHDLGFTVDYLKADNYKHDLTGILNQGERLTIENKTIIIPQNQDHYEFILSNHGITNFTQNYIHISSNSISYLYAMYLKFKNDPNYYIIDLYDIDNKNHTCLNIYNLTKPLKIIPSYNNNKLESIYYFFRNI